MDADPDANLAMALGVPDPENLVPLSQMKEMIAERTESQPGSMGGFFKFNPKVDDIPEKYARQIDGIKLIIMGGVKKGGSGCVCPESVLLRTLVTHMVLLRDEVVVMDMEAGIEHLGRATAQGVDRLIIVVEPGRRSIETACTSKIWPATWASRRSPLWAARSGAPPTRSSSERICRIFPSWGSSPSMIRSWKPT